MPKTWRVPNNDVPICPDCQRDLSFVGSWTFRGLWGYNEVRTYECPAHGRFLSAHKQQSGMVQTNAQTKGRTTVTAIR